QLLPYIEQEAVYRQFDLKFHYNAAGRPQNQAAAKNQPPAFLCPSHPYREPDPQGYGVCDYMPVAYTDIEDRSPSPDGFALGERNTSGRYRADGILTIHRQVDVTASWAPTDPTPVIDRGGGSRVEACADGTSNTIAIIEDVGKNHECQFPYMRANYNDFPNSVDSANTGGMAPGNCVAT